MNPVGQNPKFSSIHRPGTFLKTFRKKIESMYLFLPLKRHFGFSGFHCLTFLLEHFDPKIVSRVLYVLRKIVKYPDADGRTDGHQNLNGSHTKALRAIIVCDLQKNGVLDNTLQSRGANRLRLWRDVVWIRLTQPTLIVNFGDPISTVRAYVLNFVFCVATSPDIFRTGGTL